MFHLILLLGLGLAKASDPQSPTSFVVDFETDVPGTMSINVTRSLAPLGSDRFYALVQDKFFDAAAFFRVVPNFVVQFGIAGTPTENHKWDVTIPDDPVISSNAVGTLTFATAGPNTRTTQLFINLKTNKNLDGQGFAPFGTVINGMDIAAKIFNPTPGKSGGVDQNQYTNKGNKWLKKAYPKVNFITKATIRASTAAASAETLIDQIRVRRP